MIFSYYPGCTLSTKAKDYNSAYTTWKSTATNTKTDLGEKDVEEIQQKEANNEKLSKLFKKR